MSDLQRIQQEILRRFQRPRATTDNIPGFAGGNLGEQLDRESQLPDRMSGVRSSVFAPPPQQQPASQAASPQQEPATATGQVLPPTNQASITRPRSVFAPPQQIKDPNAPFGSSGQPFGASRDRRVEPRDKIADDAQYLNDLQSKPDSWKEKGIDVLRGVNQALGSNPNAFTPTKREREELKARGVLGQDIAIQKEQTAREMAQMVPIYDTAGNIIGTAPRRTSAATQIRATDTATRASETKRRNDAYIGHLTDLPKEKQAEAARKMWMSGVADGNDELKADLAKRMGLSETLPDTDKGTIQTDASGNFRVIHGRTGTSNTVTDETTGNAVGAWSPVQFKAAEEGRDKRAQARNVQSEKNATIMAGGVVSRMGDPDVHKGNIAEIDKDMESVDAEMGTILTRQADTQKGGFLPTDPATLNQLRQRKNALERERRGEREKLGKIESAQSNLSTRGRGAPTSPADGTGGSFNLKGWLADHPNATAAEARAMRAKAKARNMSIVE